MQKFIIESTVPVPERHCKYPFDKMKIGDSFFIESCEMRHKVHGAACQYRARHPNDFYYTIRKEGKGHRIWRLAPAEESKVKKMKTA